MERRLRPVFVELALLGCVVATLVLPLAANGVWDPFELEAAEASRWVAASVFGARGLSIASDPAAPPTLTDLGMGELPFTSMGLAFRVFGYHDWVGRAAMMPWAVVAVLVAYGFVRRYVGVRHAMVTAACLATLPLFYLHARSMAGEIVLQSALVLAVVGAAVAWIERGITLRALGVAVAIVGLVAGYLSRGLLLGVAVPLCAVSAASLAHATRDRSVKVVVAGALLVVGLGCAAGFFLAAIPRVDVVEPVRRVFGMVLFDPNPRASTFDRVLRHIGHGCFPWSAILPFAIGRLAAEDRTIDAPQSFVRTVVLGTIASSFLAHTALLPYAGLVPLACAPFLAVAIGIFVVDAEDGRHNGRIAAIGISAVTLLLYVDLKRDPSRLLAAFPFDGVVLPESALEHASSLLAVAAALFALVALLAFYDPPRGVDATDPDGLGVRDRLRRWVIFRIASVRRGFTAFATEANGNFAFAGVLAEAALIGLAAMLYVGGKVGVTRIEKLPRQFVSIGLAAWWVVPFASAVVLGGFVVLRDGVRGLERWLGTSRTMAVGALGALAGGLLSLGVHPSVLGQLSPREAILAYAAVRTEGAALGVVGVSARAAAFYTADPVTSFDEPREAFRFLDGSEAPRYVVFHRRDLPRLNALYRQKRGENLPVLDTRSSLLFLAGNHAVTPNQNPLELVVSSRVPSPAFPARIGFSDQLVGLGYDLLDERGKPVGWVVPGRRYTMRSYYEVLRPVSGTWQAFLHVDGQGRRHNGDHPVARGAYPMNHWQKGDVVVDDYELELEPNFLPGRYALYVGFFNTAGRMNVTSGQHDDDRALVGMLEVR